MNHSRSRFFLDKDLITPLPFRFLGVKNVKILKNSRKLMDPPAETPYNRSGVRGAPKSQKCEKFWKK